jgi:hypothetical protein
MSADLSVVVDVFGLKIEYKGIKFAKTPSLQVPRSATLRAACRLCPTRRLSGP